MILRICSILIYFLFLSFSFFCQKGRTTNLIPFKTNDGFSLSDIDGNIIIKAKDYQQIGNYDTNFICVKKEKWGVIDRNKRILLPLNYDTIIRSFKINGINTFLAEKEGNKHLVYGKKTVEFEQRFNDVFVVKDNNSATLYFIGVINGEPDSYTLLNMQGEEILKGIKGEGVILREKEIKFDFSKGRYGIIKHLMGDYESPFYEYTTTLYYFNRPVFEVEDFSNCILEVYVENPQDIYHHIVELYNIKGETIISRKDSVAKFGFMNDSTIITSTSKQVDETIPSGGRNLSYNHINENYYGILNINRKEWILKNNATVHLLKGRYVIITGPKKILVYDNLMNEISREEITEEYIFAPGVLISQKNNTLYVSIALRKKENEYLIGLYDVVSNKAKIPCKYHVINEEYDGEGYSLIACSNDNYSGYGYSEGCDLYNSKNYEKYNLDLPDGGKMVDGIKSNYPVIKKSNLFSIYNRKTEKLLVPYHIRSKRDINYPTANGETFIVYVDSSNTSHVIKYNSGEEIITAQGIIKLVKKEDTFLFTQGKYTGESWFDREFVEEKYYGLDGKKYFD